MEQYKQEGSADTPANPVKVSEESKQIRSVEATIKEMQQVINSQQQEIMRLHRDIGRLKNSVDDVINMVRSRG